MLMQKKKKNEREFKTLIQSRMKYGKEKCDMLVIKSGKRHMTDRIKLPNQEKSER